MLKSSSKIILGKLDLPLFDSIEIYLLRIDQIHPHISGNKWYKLKYNLIEAKEKGFDTLLTFGGAYSNHVYATAAAGKEFGFKTIGIIRGEVHLPLNPTLNFAKTCGMKLIYLPRSKFREIHKQQFPDFIEKEFGRVYILPEGGSNNLAVIGCSEIIKQIDIDYDYICTACGTGGTIAGLIAGSNSTKKVLGFPVLKGAEFLYTDIHHLLYHTCMHSNNPAFNQSLNQSFASWQLILNYHFGGYAKITKELVEFIIDFELTHNIPLDYIYTGKMMFGIFDLLKKNYFSKGSTIVAIHTGGLQGTAGMRKKIEKFLASKI